MTVKGELKADGQALKIKGHNNILSRVKAELFLFSSIYSPQYIFKLFSCSFVLH